MPTYDFYIKVGDLEPAIEAYLKLSDGSVFNLTGVTGVVFRWRLKNDPAATPSEGSATIVSATDGHVKYEWLTGETDVEGVFVCEWEVELSSGKMITFPNNKHDEFIVFEAIG